MNQVAFPFDVAWETANKDRLGVVIANRGPADLASDCTVLLYAIGFEKSLIGSVR
jgi:hypothetical protein